MSTLMPHLRKPAKSEAVPKTAESSSTNDLGILWGGSGISRTPFVTEPCYVYHLELSLTSRSSSVSAWGAQVPEVGAKLKVAHELPQKADNKTIKNKPQYKHNCDQCAHSEYHRIVSLGFLISW